MTDTSQSVVMDFGDKIKATLSSEEFFESACNSVAETLGDAVGCTRVWSAWHSGTMREDDFYLIADDPDRVAEITRASLGVVLDAVANLSALAAHFEAKFHERGAEIDRLQKDAARYQWLRSRDLNTIDRGGVFAGQTPDNIVLNGEDLDAAIDALI